MQQYDAFTASLYDGYFTGVPNDVGFYVNEATHTRGSILEVGCGTGRITIPIAEAGRHIVGLDASEAMLMRTQEKLTRISAAARQRIHLVHADMRDFALKQRFKLIVVPYRTFMHLLTQQDQIQALLAIREHLARGGRLIFDIYDPSLELIAGDAPDNHLHLDTKFAHPSNGHLVMAWYSRGVDIAHQIIHQDLLFEEYDDNGSLLAKSHSSLDLRFTYRYEMHYLLELCGYQVDALYGDFQLNPYRGAEQIWIARVSTRKVR